MAGGLHCILLLMQALDWLNEILYRVPVDRYRRVFDL
jgi:hypothetical protein